MSCIAVGNFDGVHKGHLKILRAAVAAAVDENTDSAVITFSVNTKNSFGNNVRYLTDNAYKRELIKAAGISEVHFLEFDKKTASLDGEAFVLLLINKYGLTHIFCGDNFRFAVNASCGVKELADICTIYGIGCTVIPTDGVSSTAVRQAVAAGEMPEASDMLGRDFSYCADFVSGNHIGRTIGFPTLNQKIDENAMLPPSGVYVTYCVKNGALYPAVTNIGTRPTVTSSSETVVETFLLGTDNLKEGIPESFKRIYFKKRIRGEIRFPDIDSLRAQIARDCEFAQKYFS